MSSLGLITEAFKPPATSMGQIKALNEYEEKVSPSIARAIDKIVNNGFLEKTKDFTKSIINPIEKLHKNINDIQESAAKERLKQQLRFLVMVVENRLEGVKLNKEQKNNIEKLFVVIHKNIGSVPVLNKKVVQPDAKFLPKKYAGSVVKWSEKVIEDPQEDFKNEKLGFIKPSKESSKLPSVSTSKSSCARQQLFEEDEDEKSAKEAYALSYANGDFYPCRDLQADHFQPVEDIVFRQMELIKAMNIDPIFCKRILEDKIGKGYFLVKKKTVFGTKKFFMDYYNCMDNLWLFNPAANSGTGKGSQDPLEWLSAHEKYGQAFFDAMGGQDSICKDCILYTTKSDIILCAAAKAWFREYHAQEILSANFMLHHVKTPMAKMVTKARKSTSKREKVRAMAKMAIVAGLAQASPPPTKKTKKSHEESDEEDYKGVPTPETRLNSENLAKMKKSNDTPAAKRARRSLIQEFSRNCPGCSGPKKPT